MLFLKTIHSKEQILPHNILSTTGNIYTWTGKEFVEIILLVNEAFKLHSITGKGISPVCGSSLILELFGCNVYDTSYTHPTGTKGRLCQHPVSLMQAIKLSAPFRRWWYVGVSVSLVQRPSDQHNYPKCRICVPKNVWSKSAMSALIIFLCLCQAKKSMMLVK